MDPVERTGLIVVLSFFAMLVLLVVGAGIMFFDLAGRREEDAAWLQQKIGNELGRDRALAGLPVRPVVHAPVGGDHRVTVELSGEVPSDAARSAVVDIVEDTALRLRRDVEIDDRLGVSRRVA
jgi:hypothetical protein